MLHTFYIIYSTKILSIWAYFIWSYNLKSEALASNKIWQLFLGNSILGMPFKFLILFAKNDDSIKKIEDIIRIKGGELQAGREGSNVENDSWRYYSTNSWKINEIYVFTKIIQDISHDLNLIYSFWQIESSKNFGTLSWAIKSWKFYVCLCCSRFKNCCTFIGLWNQTKNFQWYCVPNFVNVSLVFVLPGLENFNQMDHHT